MPYNPPASNTKAGNGQDLYLSSNGGQIQGNLAVSGNLEVTGAAAVGNGLTVSGEIIATGNVVSNAGAIQGIDSIRSNILNVSTRTTDITIPYAGSSWLITGLIRGAGPSFTVNVTLPADIATNPLYHGCTIFNSNILNPSVNRDVIIVIRNSAGTQILTTTLQHGAFWTADAVIGAAGDPAAGGDGLGLYLTVNSNTNMLAA